MTRMDFARAERNDRGEERSVQTTPNLASTETDPLRQRRRASARLGPPLPLSRERRLAQLIDQLYGAAVDHGRWPDFLGALVRATGSEAAGFIVQDLADHGGDCMWQFGFGDAFAAEWSAAITARASA